MCNNAWHMPVCLTLPSPSALRVRYPLSEPAASFIAEARRTITAILSGKDPRFLVIVGPCSIHDSIAAREYAMKLRTLAMKTPTLYFVMRTFFEKSRTSGGWKGFLYDPHLDDSNDILHGLESTRTLLLELTALEIPTAAELLEPCAAHYFSDLLSWGCIGARTTTSQIHRQLASGLPMPIAFKNSLDGHIERAVQGALVATTPHRYIGTDLQGHVSLIATDGNPHTHIVLRGGDQANNCNRASIAEAVALLHSHDLPRCLLVDCSHGNSQKQPERQPLVLHTLLDLLEEFPDEIRGAILESHLHGGHQQLEITNKRPLNYGISITDPCLSWHATEELLLAAHLRLEKSTPRRLLASLSSLAMPLKEQQVTH